MVVSNRPPLTPPLLLALGVLTAIFLAQWIAGRPISLTIWIVGGALLVIVTLLHPRVAIYLMIFSMLLSPELGTGIAAGDRPVTIRMEDILIVIIGIAWLTRTAYTKELGWIARSPLNRQIALYSSAALIATLVSGWTSEINWTRALLFLGKYLEYFVIYYMVLTGVRTRADIRHYLTAALLTAVLVALIGIAQIPSGGRVSAPFEGEAGEPNTLGGYLVLMLSIVSGFYLTSSAARERLAWAALGGLLAMPLLYTLSRSSWIAGLGMVATLLVCAPRKREMALFGASAVVLFPLLAPRPVIERVDYTFNQPVSRGQIQIGRIRLDTSSSARIESWKTGLQSWTERPLTGYGVAGTTFMDAQYVRTLTEAGILGLATFFWLAYGLWRTARDRLDRANDRFSRALATGYLAGYVALLILGIGTNTFIIIRIMEPFWLLTALVVALPLVEENVDAGKRFSYTMERRDNFA